MNYIRFGICALVAFSVAAHGGVEEWALAVLEIGASLLLLLWTLWIYFMQREQVFISPLLPPLAAFAILVCFQWVFHQTASSYHTRMSLVLLLSDLVLLFLAVQAFRTLQDMRGFVWFGMIFGFLVSIFGILQHVAFNGKIYWFREMHYGGIPFGPYVNRNHFAGFVELIVPLALVPLVLGRVRRERWLVVGLFAVVPIGALALSASRGGIISLGVELLVLASLMVMGKTAGKQMIAGAVVLLVALLLVSWLGVNQLLQRFATLQSLEVSAGKRASMRRDTWRIFLEHPIIGTGIGTLELVYPPYESLYDGKVVNHTHNDYLEALAETGILGGACCSWFLVTLALESWKRIRQFNDTFAGALHSSGLVACSGFLVHSFVDFNLHIPSNALLFFLMAHLATAPMQLPSTPSTLPGSRRRISRND